MNFKSMIYFWITMSSFSILYWCSLTSQKDVNQTKFINEDMNLNQWNWQNRGWGRWFWMSWWMIWSWLNLSWEAKDLFDKMLNSRKNQDFTWAQQFRQQLQEKYPEIFNWFQDRHSKFWSWQWKYLSWE